MHTTGALGNCGHDIGAFRDCGQAVDVKDCGCATIRVRDYEHAKSIVRDCGHTTVAVRDYIHAADVGRDCGHTTKGLYRDIEVAQELFSSNEKN